MLSFDVAVDIWSLLVVGVPVTTAWNPGIHRCRRTQKVRKAPKLRAAGRFMVAGGEHRTFAAVEPKAGKGGKFNGTTFSLPSLRIPRPGRSAPRRSVCGRRSRLQLRSRPRPPRSRPEGGALRLIAR